MEGVGLVFTGTLHRHSIWPLTYYEQQWVHMVRVLIGLRPSIRRGRGKRRGSRGKPRSLGQVLAENGFPPEDALPIEGDGFDELCRDDDFFIFL